MTIKCSPRTHLYARIQPWMTGLQSSLYAVFAASLLIGSAYGQTGNEASNSEDDEVESRLQTIQVTAQKREQSVNDISATINVFSGEHLSDLGVETAEDLETLTSGLTVTEALPNGVPVFTIRGVGFADFSTSGSSTVGLYFDEVNLPYSVMGRSLLLDVERVEILKGPQGDLYGRNTTGGQINFISRQPTQNFELNTKGTVGNYDSYDIETAISGALTDRIQARLAGKYVFANSGWQQNLDGAGTIGRKGEGAVRGLLNFDVYDDVSVMINTHYFSSNSDNTVPTPFDTSPTYDSLHRISTTDADPTDDIDDTNRQLVAWSEGFRPQRDNDLFGTSIKAEWDINNGLSLVSLTAYEHLWRREQFDISGVTFQNGDYADTTNISVVSQELRLSGDYGDNINWVSGLFYAYDTISNQTDVLATISVLGTTATSNYNQTTHSIALFSRGEWQFHPDFRLSFGGRYTHEDRAWSGCTYDRGDSGLLRLWNTLDYRNIYPLGDALDDLSSGGCATYDEVTETFAPFSSVIQADRFMWRLTFDYTPTDNILIYTSASEGFKSGGFNGSLALLHSQLDPYRPETLFSYELGIKSAWLSRSLQVNAALFYYDYRDKQENTIAVTPIGNLGALVNIPRSRIIGLEMDMQWFLTRTLSLGLNAIYLNSEILEYTAICQEAIEGVCEGGSSFGNVMTYDASGLSLPNSPEFQATLTAQYVQHVPYGMTVTIGGDLAYKDDNVGSIQPLVSSYALVNARIALAPSSDQWSVMVWGRNVFDAEYWVATSQSICCRTRTYGEPATFGVTASVNF